jgi:hypothetical protein
MWRLAGHKGACKRTRAGHLATSEQPPPPKPGTVQDALRRAPRAAPVRARRRPSGCRVRSRGRRAQGLHCARDPVTKALEHVHPGNGDIRSAPDFVQRSRSHEKSGLRSARASPAGRSAPDSPPGRDLPLSGATSGARCSDRRNWPKGHPRRTLSPTCRGPISSVGCGAADGAPILGTIVTGQGRLRPWWWSMSCRDRTARRRGAPGLPDCA